MPAVTKQQHPDQTLNRVPSKKRRLDDDSSDNNAVVQQLRTPPACDGFFSPLQFATSIHTSSDHDRHSTPDFFAYAPPQHPTRKLVPLPPNKRLRGDVRPLSPHNDTLKSPTREHLRETTPNTTPQPDAQQFLSRCHICHRKPVRKSDLDSFGTCEGCGQRSCFVCLRECPDWRSEVHKDLGWSTAGLVYDGMADELDTGKYDDPRSWARQTDLSEEEGGARRGAGATKDGGGRWAATDGGGHRKKICSRCCVERGPDGDVVCLGCLPFAEG